MNFSIKDVLRDKKGVVEALGVTVIVMTLLVAVGMVVANYAILSKQASMLTSLSQEVTNRAEAYAGALNADMMNPQTPSLARECSTTTEMCTQILAVTTAEDGSAMELRIQADAVVTLGQSVVRDVKLISNEVTHVTAIDDDGRNVWALTDEGLRFRAWDLAEGKPSEVPDDELEGPKSTNKWVAVDDRAGIDSTGSLWVWGKNNIGQAGVGTTTTTPVEPQRVSAPGTSFRSVLTADDRAYAIDSNGYAWVWGKNDKGQLGLGHANAVKTPTKIKDQRMLTFAIGKNNVFGITMSGDLMVVGASQPGFPANTGFQWQVLNPGKGYTAVAASLEGAVALIDDAGKLTMVNNKYPFPVVATGTFTSVSLGSTAGYAIGGTGNLYSWGTGSDGRLGLGAVTSAGLPTNIKPIKSGQLFTSVSALSTGAIAIDSTGRVHYVGVVPAGALPFGNLPQANVITAFLSAVPSMNTIPFRQVEMDASGTAGALLDTNGNLYGMGTEKAGLWPMNYLGAEDQPIRMPVPDGFSSYTWK